MSITSGWLELKREHVELSAVVRNAVETSEPVVQAGHHQLDISLPGEALWIEGDPIRLSQILSNLLNNAAKYTPDGGLISLAARRDGESVSISVSDNGIGIATEGLTRIFEMFAREARIDGRARGGRHRTDVVAPLAEMHGGSLEARSKGEGHGAEFVVRLPLAAPAVKRAAEPKPLTLSSPMRVLIVDDNRDSAASLGMVLEMLGAEVTLAHDGRSAIDAFSADDASVVLLDIGLPGMDGYEVARTLRARHPERRPTIVAITGWGQEEDRRKAREAGIDHHMIKPADIGQLQDLLVSLAR